MHEDTGTTGKWGRSFCSRCLGRGAWAGVLSEHTCVFTSTAALLVPAMAAAPEAWPSQPIHSRVMPMAVIGELCAPGEACRPPPTTAAATRADTPGATCVASEPA